MSHQPFRFSAAGLAPLWKLAIAALVTVGFSLGCSRESAVAPGAGSGFDDGRFVQVFGPGEQGNAAGAIRNGNVGGLGTVLVVESELVDPAIPATIENGRFTMKVPAGALDGVAVFKLTRDPAGYQVVCTLEPHATPFNTPVEVYFDLHGTDAALHENVRAQWYDESSGTWKDVPSVWDPKTQILIGYYEHFCSGRAGW